MKKLLPQVRLAATFVGVLSLFSFANAEEIAAAEAEAVITPEAQEVFDAYVEAIGGRELLETIDSVRIEGNMAITAMGMNADLLMIKKAPNHFYSEQVVNGMGKMVQAYDGEIGWASDPMQGYRELTGEELKLLIDQNGVHSDVFLDERYSSAKISEDAESEGHIVVEGIRETNGNVDSLYFDVSSKLLVKIEAVEDMGPQGSMPISVTMGDYTEFDGILFATSLMINNPAMNMEMTFSNYSLNQEIEVGQFSYSGE